MPPFLDLFRSRQVDAAKARAYTARLSAALFRAAVADGDAQRSEPAHAHSDFLVGTKRDVEGHQMPIRLAPEDLAAHWLVQGGTGTGKTSFGASLVAWCLRSSTPIGVVDCKSGFFESALQWSAATAFPMDAAARAAFIKDLAVINPFGEELPPFNLCRLMPGYTSEVQAYDITLGLSRLFDVGLSLHMENVMRHLLILLIESELSLLEAPAVLQDELLRGVLVMHSNNPRVKEFFLRTYALLPESSKNALIARLQSLLLSENLRLMFGADQVVDLRKVLDQGRPLLVFLGKSLQVPEAQVTVLGSLLLQLVFQAAYGLSGRHRPYLLMLDEFFHLLEAPELADRFVTALTTLRSYGMHLALIMHQFTQVPPALRETILGNCDLMALFRTSSRNAEFFGDMLPNFDPEMVREALRRSSAPPSRREVERNSMEQLQRLPNRHCYWFDRRRPHRSLLLRVPDLLDPHESIGISRRELDQFLTEYRVASGGLAIPRNELRRQIAAREARLRQLIQPPIAVVTNVDAETQSSISTVASTTATTRRRRPRLG